MFIFRVEEATDRTGAGLKMHHADMSLEHTKLSANLFSFGTEGLRPTLVNKLKTPLDPETDN